MKDERNIADMLHEAFQNWDVNKLSEAICLGADLNMQDDDDGILWEDIGVSFGYIRDCYGEIAEAVIQTDNAIREKHLIDFMDLAIKNGLNFNIAYYSEVDQGWYAPVFYLVFYVLSPSFLSYLLKNGLNVNLIIGNETLLDRIEREALASFYDICSDSAGALWTEWMTGYLKKHGAKNYKELAGDKSVFNRQ